MLKKLLIIGGVLAVGVLWTLWFVGGKNLGKVAKTSTLATVKEGLPAPVKKVVPDQDGDGIPDWEESYRGTDPQKPDPAQDQNPDEVALTLIRRAQEQKTGPLVPASSFTGEGALAYQLADLTLSENQEPEFLVDYWRKLKEILAVYQNPGLGNELPLVAQAAETGEFASIEVNQAASRYQQTVEALLALPAPSSAQQIHLNLVNIFSKLDFNALVMSQFEAEPALALGAANVQPVIIRQFLREVENINVFFYLLALGLGDSERLSISLAI